MSPPERALWKKLRSQKIGFRFRRQYPAGKFFIDFYCPETRLGIEVDGFIHEFSRQRDSAKDKWLEEHGIRIVRVDTFMIGRDISSVVEYIRAVCLSRQGLTISSEAAARSTIVDRATINQI